MANFNDEREDEYDFSSSLGGLWDVMKDNVQGHPSNQGRPLLNADPDRIYKGDINEDGTVDKRSAIAKSFSGDRPDSGSETKGEFQARAKLAMNELINPTVDKPEPGIEPDFDSGLFDDLNQNDSQANEALSNLGYEEENLEDLGGSIPAFDNADLSDDEFQKFIESGDDGTGRKATGNDVKEFLRRKERQATDSGDKENERRRLKRQGDSLATRSNEFDRVNGLAKGSKKPSKISVDKKRGIVTTTDWKGQIKKSDIRNLPQVIKEQEAIEQHNSSHAGSADEIDLQEHIDKANTPEQLQKVMKNYDNLVTSTIEGSNFPTMRKAMDKKLSNMLSQSNAKAEVASFEKQQVATQKQVDSFAKLKNPSESQTAEMNKLKAEVARLNKQIKNAESKTKEGQARADLNKKEEVIKNAESETALANNEQYQALNPEYQAQYREGLANGDSPKAVMSALILSRQNEQAKASQEAKYRDSYNKLSGRQRKGLSFEAYSKREAKKENNVKTKSSEAKTKLEGVKKLKEEVSSRTDDEWRKLFKDLPGNLKRQGFSGWKKSELRRVSKM